MSNIAEVAIPYAILALHDDNVEVNEENIKKLLKAANIEVDAVWISIFVKAMAGKNIDDMLSAFTASAGPAVAVSAGVSAAAAGAAAPAAKEEAKKEAAKEESDDDMGFGLFD